MSESFLQGPNEIMHIAYRVSPRIPQKNNTYYSPIKSVNKEMEGVPFREIGKI